MEVLSVGLEVTATDGFPFKLTTPPLYSIVLPFESLVDISLDVVNDTRVLCHKAKNSQGGFNFVKKDSLDPSKLNRRGMTKWNCIVLQKSRTAERGQNTRSAGDERARWSREPIIRKH